MAIEGEGAIAGEASEGVARLRWRAWLLQREEYLRARLLGVVTALTGNVLLLRAILYVLAVFMVIYPPVVFVSSLRAGVLIVSPPLAAMFVGGFVSARLAGLLDTRSHDKRSQRTR